jgi:hypothetical protein
MKHRLTDRPRRVDGDSPLTDRILMPQGPQIEHQEGRSNVAGIGQATLAIVSRAAFLTGVAPSGRWRPIQSP